MSGMGLSRLPILEKISWRPNRTQVVRFAVSLILAVLLWGWVERYQDPFIERQYPEVAISMDGFPESLQIVSQLPNVTVTVTGAESELSSVNRSSVAATLDLSGVDGPGTYVIPVRSDVSGARETSVEPREVLINVEERLTRVYPLVNDPQEDGGDSRSIGTVSPEVSQVTVVGPSSAIQRVDRVILPVTLGQQVSDFTTTLTPVAVDANGQQIAEVEINPAAITATVQVRTRGKEVAVLATVVGNPAEGFQVQQRRAVPDTVLVDGPPEVLADLLFVNTLPVDVTDRSESFSERTGLADLPEGVTVVDSSGGSIEVRVALSTTAEASQTLNSLPIEHIGLGEDLEVTFSPPVVAIQVTAPADILQNMQSSDIAVLIDITGLGPGVYALSPAVTLPQGATWLGNDPATVRVTVTSTADASPEASPSSSPEGAEPSPRASPEAWHRPSLARSQTRSRATLFAAREHEG